MMSTITKDQHDSGACWHLEAAGHGECPWCALLKRSAAGLDRPEFVADELTLQPREEWQR